MAKQQQEENAVASLNPDDMLQGGLKDDFRGRVIEAVYCRWDYDGNVDVPVLAARLTIKVPGEDAPVVQHWSAGNLDSFVPSQDGKTPAEEEEVGPYALRIGKRAQLNNNTNFAHLMHTIIDSGEASKKFSKSDLSGELSCLETLDAQWNRVPQKQRSGMAALPGQEEGKSRARDVLVVTEVWGYNEEEEEAPKATKKAAPAKPAVKPKANGKVPEPEPDEDATVDDLDSDIQEILVAEIADKGSLKKGKIAQLVLAKMAKDPRKSKAVQRSMQADFIENGPWTFDEEAGTLAL